MSKTVLTMILVYVILMNICGQVFPSSLQSELLQKSAFFENGTKVQLPTAIRIDSLNEYQSLNSDLSKLNGNAATIIDKLINPAQYLLGCGDALKIYIWGATEKTIQVTINAEGIIILPLIGPFTLGGKSLSQVRQELTEKILTEYKHANCSIELYSIRQFKIYITGNIAKPGSYIVNPVTRASEAIMMAGGISNNGKSRGIIIKNDTYGNKELDLLTYVNNSDMEKNPYLKEGDQIFIPFKKEFVTISGSISRPGEYDFCQGDNLKSIILAAGGFTRNADTSNIILTRFLNNADSLETIKLGFPESESTEIKPDDRIIIASIPNYRILRQVYISGEVTYPGLYPIRNDKTSLKELIKAAGGLTPQASLHSSKITRKNHFRTGNREYERLKAYPLQMQSPIEANYLKVRSIEEDGLISIDLEKLLNKNNDLSDIVLRDDDQIFIAKKELTIKVSGAVSSPGLTSFANGKDVNYYAQQAGGFLPSAKKSKIMIIKNGTNNFLPIRKVNQLDAGDVIIIPEKEYINRMNFTKDILVIAGSVATIVLSLFAVNNYLK